MHIFRRTVSSQFMKFESCTLFAESVQFTFGLLKQLLFKRKALYKFCNVRKSDVSKSGSALINPVLYLHSCRCLINKNCQNNKIMDEANLISIELNRVTFNMTLFSTLGHRRKGLFSAHTVNLYKLTSPSYSILY